MGDARGAAQQALDSIRSGRWDDAARHAATAVERAEDPEVAAEHPEAVAAGALVPAARGELVTAYAFIERAAALVDARPNALATAILLRARLCLAVGLNDWNELERLEAAAERSRFDHGFAPEEWFALRLMAQWHLGHREQSDELLAEFRRLPGHETDAYFWAYDSILHNRDAEHAAEVQSIRRAVDLAGPEMDPLGRTWIRLVAGTAISKHGVVNGPAEGLQIYREARTELVHLKAAIFVARCDSIIETTSRLVAERDSVDQLSLLTEQQLKVASRVAEGRTSMEIAEQLHISKKTVDFHVANVMARLGLTNRRQLRQVVGHRGTTT